MSVERDPRWETVSGGIQTEKAALGGKVRFVTLAVLIDGRRYGIRIVLDDERVRRYPFVLTRCLDQMTRDIDKHVRPRE